MIRINLLAEKRVRKGGAPAMPGVAPVAGEGFRPIYFVYILLVVLAIAVVGVRYFQLTGEVAKREKKRVELEKERNRLAEIIRKANEFDKQKQLLEAKIAVINELKKKQRAPVILLDQLSRNLPEYVWFESVTESNFNIAIDAWALNPNKISDFMDNLSNSGYFINIEMLTFQKREGRVSFKLTATFQIPEGQS